MCILHWTSLFEVCSMWLVHACTCTMTVWENVEVPSWRIELYRVLRIKDCDRDVCVCVYVCKLTERRFQYFKCTELKKPSPDSTFKYLYTCKAHLLNSYRHREDHSQEYEFSSSESLPHILYQTRDTNSPNLGSNFGEWYTYHLCKRYGNSAWCLCINIRTSTSVVYSYSENNLE